MKCARCGEIIDVGEGRCRRCGEKPRGARAIESPGRDRAPRGPGLLRRLFRALLPRFESTRFAARITTGPNAGSKLITESYTWHDSNTGETRHWDRWEDVPPDIQKKITALRGRLLGDRTPADADVVVTESAGDLDHLPSELQANVRALMDTNPAPNVTIRTVRDIDFACTDESGETRRYESLEDMPPEIRARLKKFMRERGGR